jgi:UDPglucose 6-dehydrogenase
MRQPRMADLRNVYEREDVLAAGFEAYVGVGR